MRPKYNPREGISTVKFEKPTKYKHKKFSPRYKEEEAKVCENCEIEASKCNGKCKCLKDKKNDCKNKGI